MENHMTATFPNDARVHYDRLTIALHWLTAALVISLFAIIELRGFLPRGGELREQLEYLHISLGIILFPTVLIRLLWRLVNRGDLPPATSGLQELAARSAHLVLYVLLVTQVALGFLLRWAQGEPFTFFGLFSIPQVFAVDPSLRRTFGELHENVAWAIIILASLHAAAAIFHHYVLKDQVLMRMVPGSDHTTDSEALSS
jgi:cytochrome b561